MVCSIAHTLMQSSLASTGDDSLLEYQDTSDLSEKLEKSLSGDEWKTTAERGWQVSHDIFSSKTVTGYVVDTVMGGATNGSMG